jgi:ABC-type dipeptide/oligopeptide/nickel transport system permease subunit
VVGPAFAPHGLGQIVSLPNQNPSASFPLGTDYVGRDVLSRFLNGGRSLIALAFVATASAYFVGVPIGLASGYLRGRVDRTIMVLVDILISLPPIILILILVSGGGQPIVFVVIGVALAHLPRVIRIVRAATLDIAARGFVERAEARGERLLTILGREILPNIWTPILADFGLRLSSSIILVASLSFLGFGLQPPAADWALMVNENRTAIYSQPYSVLIPAITIGLLAIAVNLIGDSVARSLGRSSTA